MSEITGPNEALPPAIQLGEPAPPPLLPPYADLPPLTPPLQPIPFEDLETFPGFWARVGAMFQLVFSEPMTLFDRVPLTEGLGAPWRFLLLMSVPIFLIVAAVFFFAGMGIMMAALESKGLRGEGGTVAAVMPIIFGVILLLMPLLSFLGMVIFGALNHFFLWMWGGLKHGHSATQTIRANGYASAFLQIGALIPYLGALVQLAGMVVIGIGLARMHKTDTWRGICAVLTPLVLMCCCLVPAVVMFAIYIGSHAR